MLKIEKLTPEQEIQAAQFEASWRREDHSTEPIDQALTASVVNKFYNLMLGAKPPQIIFVQSPFQLLLLPLLFHHHKIAPKDPIQFLRERLSRNLCKCFDSSAWPLMEESLWRETDKMFAQLSSASLLIDDQGLLPLALPGRGYKVRVSDRHRCGTAAQDLDQAWHELHEAMFSRVIAHLDRSVLTRLRELVHSDRPSLFPDPLIGPDQKQSSLAIRRQILASLVSALYNKTELGYEDLSLTRYTWYGRWGNVRLLFHQFVRECILPNFLDQERDDSFAVWLALSRGGIAYQFFQSVCFVCMAPSILKCDERSRLHSDSGYALRFPDGYGLHSWHGLNVPKYVIEEPSKITTEDIESERNVELKRVKIQRFGEERYLENSGYETLDESNFGTLMRKNLSRDEPLVMVRVKNSTPESDGSFKHYYLRVPPETTTAREGVAWTFGMDAEDYQLVEES